MRSIQLNMHEAKTHLSRQLRGMQPDDRLIICNRHRPVTSDTTQTFDDLEADKTYLIREGEAKVIKQPRPSAGT